MEDGTTEPLPGPPRPRGLQRERTLLAWNRTILTLLVAIALVVHAVGPPYPRLAHAPALVIALVALWLSLSADLRYRRTAPEARLSRIRHMAVLSLSSVALGAGGIVAIVTGPG